MTLEIGNLIHNRYHIDEILARGGMGAIYAATDKSLGVKVALKENLFSNEDATRQFRREATILAAIRHPNLPRVTDHFVIPDQGQYLVMDFIEGEDLRHRLNRIGYCPEEEAILIGTAICEALTYLHKRNPPILHRDIKPGNIKVTPSGEVYLVDFGLAKEAKIGQATTTGAQSLTPGYASPEQYGQGTEPRSDIYSLGATLYAALTGKIPEDGLARLMGSIELTPLREHNPKISQNTAHVIEKALSIDVNQRYENADSYKQGLLNANATARRIATQNKEVRVVPFPTSDGYSNVYTKAASGSPIVDYSIPDTPTKTPAPPKRRRLPLWLTLLGAGGILIGSLVCAVVIFGNSAGFPAAFINRATQTASATHTLPATEQVEITATIEHATEVAVILNTATITLTPEPTLTFTPAVTPLGGGNGEIAFASDRSGIPQIWRVKINGEEPVQITNETDGACQPNWSPDGTRIVFTSPCNARKERYDNAGLFMVNVDGTGREPVLVGGNADPSGDFDPDWSPDGKNIAFTSLRENNLPHIFIYNLESKMIEKRISNPSTRDRNPAWSPDGTKMIFESTRLGVQQIWTVDLGEEGATPRELSNLNFGSSFMPAWSTNDLVVFSHGSSGPWLVTKNADSFTAPENNVGGDSPLRFAWQPDFSSDGLWIVFERLNDNNYDINLFTINGAQLSQLTDDPAVDFHPAWRPDLSP